MASGIKWLKDQLARFERKHARAEVESSRLKAVVASLRNTLDALSPTKSKEVRTVAAAPLSHANGQNGAGKLKRQPLYQNGTLNDAIQQILSAAAEGLHQDDLVRQVFQITDDAEFERAKSSLTARLSVGTKGGVFKALGGGRYAIANGRMEG